ncbi:clavesin-2 [Caerostris darwini]|uniref:Clavesin-2 n=1 Tax=Caerostris darwini TaxID=1538125 RepID=A0AAV4PU37_9ARAC|nr:clavesin-2 [Caerostris darwini]
MFPTTSRKASRLKDFEPNLDEDFLLRFLRVAKFNTSKAFTRLQDYHKVQDKCVDFFKNCSLLLAKARKQRFLWILSQRPQDGSLVLISEMGKVDHSKLSVEEMAYLPLIIGETLLKNPSTQKCGMSVIVDASGFQYRNVFHYTPKITRFYFEVVLVSFYFEVVLLHLSSTSVWGLCQRNSRIVFSCSQRAATGAICTKEFLLKSFQSTTESC